MNDVVGSESFEVAKFCKNVTPTKEWIELRYKQHKSAEIQVESKFIPNPKKVLSQLGIIGEDSARSPRLLTRQVSSPSTERSREGSAVSANRKARITNLPMPAAYTKMATRNMGKPA